MSKQVTMKIDGMHCNGCALGLTGALEKVPGVLSAQASYPEKTAVVVWDGDAAHEAALRAAVQGAGFQVTSFDE